jgi:hypothetical protein
MDKKTKLAVWVVLPWAAGTVGAQSCVRVEAGKPLQLETAQTQRSWLAPDSAAALLAYSRSAGAFDSTKALARSGANNAPKPNEPYAVDTPLAATLLAKAGQAGASRAALRVMFVDAQGKATHVDGGYPFYLAPSESDAVAKAAACGFAGTAGMGASPPVADARPATDAECVAVALAKGLVGRPYESWLLFNSAGTLCYAPDLLRQRDRLHFAQVLLKGELLQESARAVVTACSTPTPGPVVLAPPVTFDSLKLQSAKQVTEPFDIRELARPVECGSASPVVAVTVIDAKGVETSKSSTLSLYDRYTAVIHLGVLNSKLRNADYGLRASGGASTLVNKEADDRGPEYTALVVIQALPRYFQSGLSYPGRDLLHDNETLDRVGLVMGFGIKEPAKRFGLGLSYELTRGVNVVAVHEWFRRDQLDGLRVGDTFSGAAADIPLRKTWSKGWAFGLSIDLGFVTQVFGGKK